jgi:hypothetical protein
MFRTFTIILWFCGCKADIYGETKVLLQDLCVLFTSSYCSLTFCSSTVFLVCCGFVTQSPFLPICTCLISLSPPHVTRIFLFNYENNQQDAVYRLIYYSKLAVHVSGDVFTHHQEHLTVFTVSGSVHPSCCRLVSRIRCVYTPHNLHSSISTHPRHQPAATWVNTTRYCKYSQVLLVIGKNIARNM